MDREVILNRLGYTKRTDNSYFKLKDGTMLSFKDEKQAMRHAKIIIGAHITANALYVGLIVVLFRKLMSIL